MWNVANQFINSVPIFYMQFTRYLHMYDPDAGIKVVPCDRYSTETCGAKLVVTKEWYEYIISHLSKWNLLCGLHVYQVKVGKKMLKRL